MDIIKRAVLFGAKAIVSVVDSSDILNEVMATQGFSEPVARAMGKLLTITAFMSGNFKSEGSKLTLMVDGGGAIGKMIACGDYGAKVRARCDNPKACMAAPNTSVEQLVGNVGQLQVIRDLGMKQPYNGVCSLVNGSIDFDFAYYFTESEQLPTAISCASVFKDGKCIKNGGIIIQPMPNCEDYILTVLEDIATNFGDYASIMMTKTPEEIINYYFGHFEIKILDDIVPQYKCSCSIERICSMVKALGKQEALKICEESGSIEVVCEFCNKKYTLNTADIQKIFDETDKKD
ncbi:MAG: Hsp33 family molecular chaperone HslO [Clostridia bacterium]